MKDRIKEKFQNLKLNQKISLVIMLLVVVPMILFSVFLYQNFSAQTIQQLKDELSSQIQEQYLTMQKILEFSNMTEQSFMEHDGLKDMLSKLKTQKPIGIKEYLAFARNDIVALERLVNSNPYLYQVRVYAWNDEFPEMMPILYHRNRMDGMEWYQNPEFGKWRIDYEDTVMEEALINSPRHLMGLPEQITDDDGNVLGIIEVAVDMKEFFHEMFTEDSQTWAYFQNDNQIIYDLEKAESGKIWKRIKEMLPESTGKDNTRVEYVKLDGNPMLITVQEIKELSGRYIQVNSIQEPMKQLAIQKYLIVLVLLLVFAGLAAAVSRIVKTLLKNFYQMLAVVQSVQQGKLERRMPDLGKDEIGNMSRQFNKMLDHIQILMKENLEREILIKNTEIKALQNQINVHFLYNVLEAIKMMAEIKEEYEISDSVTALGELLRYGMKWTSSDVTIREELNYIRNYVKLMNLRYDFEIILSVNIPENIKEQKIPKMSLQPIVENAICHGIAETESDATIYIKAVCQKDEYEIEITDSGRGMNEAQMEILNKKVSGEIDECGGSGNGIGLKNVQDRIRIKFGKEYGLYVISREGCFTKVGIRLPYIEKRQGTDKREDIREDGSNHEDIVDRRG